VWSGRDYSLIKVLAGHEGRLMAADLTCEGQPGGMLVGTASFDKTIKLWAPEEELPDLDMVF
jgi:U4/U6 small nuclear ribonucleoprotein PRP4